MALFPRSLALLSVHLPILAASACGAAPVELRAGSQAWILTPETLELVGRNNAGTSFTVSAPRQQPVPVTDLTTSGSGAAWRVPSLGIAFQASVEEKGALGFAVQFRDPETSLTWPVQPLEGAGARALIWPRREGHYIPLDDPAWTASLRDDACDTLEGLSMPFWGVEGAGGILACLCDTQFHNRITFGESTSDPLVLRFSHTWRAGEPSTLRFRFRLSEPGGSPLMPAFEYRRWLQEEHRFVSLAEKMRQVPAAEKLAGAPLVYLWGGGILTRFDLARGNANRLAKQLVEKAALPGATPAARIRSLLPESAWQTVRELAASSYKLPYAQSALAGELSRLLADPGFYDPAAWKETRLSSETQSLLARPAGDLPREDQIRLNRLLLFDAFPDTLPRPETWGGSLSPLMLEAFSRAGLDRLRIGLDGWEAMAGNASFAREAERLGYLIGPYDSYHSIHDPRLKGSDGTWPTAQFDQALFETGAIVNRDGSRRKGYKQKGYLLSPAAARPWVEKRVGANALLAPFNYYFFDCDGFGQVYDDYSPLHPATQMSDAAARCARMAWVAGKYGAVIGTEGGSAYAAASVHLFEGAFQDGFGWGDPDMTDRKSPWYVGAYFPPEAPAVFFKPVPAKDNYVHLQYDPRFRLPLFEAVFHDSVVSGHHWSAASLKFSNVQTTVALTELLYQVPPMYHLNPEEFEKKRGEIVRQYGVFSPLHRVSALLPLTGFEWLSEDRLVQKTVFGGRIEIVANFSGREFDWKGARVPAGALSWQVDGSAPGLFRPTETAGASSRLPTGSRSRGVGE